jgi:hypothetical protein
MQTIFYAAKLQAMAVIAHHVSRSCYPSLRVTSDGLSYADRPCFIGVTSTIRYSCSRRFFAPTNQSSSNDWLFAARKVGSLYVFSNWSSIALTSKMSYLMTSDLHHSRYDFDSSRAVNTIIHQSNNFHNSDSLYLRSVTLSVCVIFLSIEASSCCSC